MSGSPARAATAEDLFERRVPPLYHLADDSGPGTIAAASHAMAVRFRGGGASSHCGADHVLIARSDHPCVIKEVRVTTCHVFWELAHVFFEHPGLLASEVVA